MATSNEFEVSEQVNFGDDMKLRASDLKTQTTYESKEKGHFEQTIEGSYKKTKFVVKLMKEASSSTVCGYISTDKKQQWIQLPFAIYQQLTLTHFGAMTRDFLFEYGT